MGISGLFVSVRRLARRGVFLSSPMQLDYIQGMGARCAGSDPDIVALAQVAKRLKRVYFTGRYAGPASAFTLLGGFTCMPGAKSFFFRGPSMLFQPPGLGNIKVRTTASCVVLGIAQAGHASIQDAWARLALRRRSIL